MTVALMGLMVIQAYWIKNAFTLKEAEFARSVESALSQVVVRLEKLEAGTRLRKYKESASLYRKIDSLNVLIDKRIEELAVEHPELRGTSGQRDKGLSETDFFDVDNGWRTIRRNDTVEVLYDSSQVAGKQQDSGSDRFDPQSDKRIRRLYRQRSRVMDELVRRSFILNDVFHNLMDISAYKAVEDRLDVGVIDSLLNMELENEGISTRFEFGVYIPSRNILTLQRTGAYPEKLLNSGFPIRLFPSNKAATPSYLLIYFPNEVTFVMSQIWWLLLLSALLVIVIIYAFSYTILSIIRQKKLQDMKNDFINNMTHEFKTPVSTIALACEALGDKDVVKSDELYQTYIRMISEENQRLGKMAEKVLEAASFEKGKLNMKEEPVDLHDIIRDVVHNISIQVESNGGKIETELNSKQAMVTGDRLHLTNMVYNLIDNANKYSPVKPLIRIATQKHGRNIKLIVSDNGIGISRSNQKKIFDRLYRVPTGDIHDVKGYGLGLSYVKAIIENHGGNIEVKSELNHGSEFIVTLPLVHETITK